MIMPSGPHAMRAREVAERRAPVQHAAGLIPPPPRGSDQRDERDAVAGRDEEDGEEEQGQAHCRGPSLCSMGKQSGASWATMRWGRGVFGVGEKRGKLD